MNYTEAKEIVSPSKTNRFYWTTEIDHARGYLECHAKAEKLVEALKRALVLCPQIGNKEWFEDILDQWAKENDKGEGK